MAAKMNEPTVDSALLTMQPSQEPHLLNPLVLAYVGDAVYEMYVRQYLVSLPNHRPQHLHQQATTYVSANAQANALKLWLPELTEEELNMVKRGRNAKSGSSPKNADILDYRHSTAFECLIGYLYYKGQFTRLRQLMDMALQNGS